MLTETSLAESIRIDDFCHANGIALIKVGCQFSGQAGLAGTLGGRAAAAWPAVLASAQLSKQPDSLAAPPSLTPTFAQRNTHISIPTTTSCPFPPLVALLQADIRGVFAQVFCDFGPAFEVLDVDGERARGGWGAGRALDPPGLQARKHALLPCCPAAPCRRPGAPLRPSATTPFYPLTHPPFHSSPTSTPACLPARLPACR